MKSKIMMVGIILLVIGAGMIWYLKSQSALSPENNNLSQINNWNVNQPGELTAADRVGQQLSNGRCRGTDKPKLTHLPMNSEDFSMIIPYGLTAGGHVTPIDHQYFSPADYQSARDSYEVYAMADSRIVDLSPRPRTDANGQPFEEWRFVFTLSCRLFYYYDLVTSLAPDIKAAYEAQGNRIDFPVTAGQLLGRIGGQTLDFAVWDTDRLLTGFVVPEHYVAEPWKLHTADPLEYYTDALKAQALSKYIRTAEPRSGKIDHDVDGQLIGNWFKQGTNGYKGNQSGGGEYWTGHLAVSLDHIDPTGLIVSIGNWPGGASQFAVIGNAPDPASVGLATGLVKFELGQIDYLVGSRSWDRMTLQSPIRLVAGSNSQGCFLAQLTSSRALKGEAFKGKSCASVSGFTDAAIIYER